MVTIVGVNIEESRDLKCRFGTVEIIGKYVNSVSMICESPPGIVGSNVSLSVSRNGEDYSPFAESPFVYIVSIFVESVSPSFGTRKGGTLLTVRGVGFEELHLAGLNSTVTEEPIGFKCWFGDEISTTAEFVSDIEVTCFSPKPATMISSVNVNIGLSDKFTKTLSHVVYEYSEDAVLNSIESSSGPISGGTSVLITGENFVDNDSLSCFFGN